MRIYACENLQSLELTESRKISEKENLTTKSLLGSQKVHKMNNIAQTLANTLVKTTTSSAPISANIPREGQSTEIPNSTAANQKPCEGNAYGVETGDGVLVGHPPPYPPGLLDWESPEDNEEFEELVSNRQARIHARAPTNNHGSQAGSHEEKKRHDSDSDDEWICL